MTESPTQSPQNATTSTNNDNQTVPKIPIEIVSDEEMALIEAALAAAATARSSLSSASSSSLSPTQFQKSGRSIQSITLLSKRRLPDWGETSSIGDIEDTGGGFRSSTQKSNRVAESLLTRFRKKRGLSVTDITSTEWCEKKMEFILRLGKQEITEPMKAGHARHVQLEEEVVQRVRVRVKSVEDAWAEKFMKFILGSNQLLFDGLTRELPLIGFVEGVWMVGVVDEVRMPITETERNPTLVDTKTRKQATIPAEAQQRNGRLQLMCYKYLWDNPVADNFSSSQFFEFYSLNPNYVLSEEIREYTAKSGFPAVTLDDIVRYFGNACSMLPPAHDQLLLRYEFQEDNSLLGEDQFAYDFQWVKGQIQYNLEFWQGKREANYTPKEERWKCNFCKFAFVCPVNTNPAREIR